MTSKLMTPETVTLEGMMEEQGLLYFGGYIVKRFPQYSFLGQNVTADDATWVGVISRQERKLMIPSYRFFGPRTRKIKSIINCNILF